VPDHDCTVIFTISTPPSKSGQVIYTDGGGTIFIVRKQIRCISRFGSSGIRQTGYAASSGYEDGNKEEKDYDQDKTTGHPLHDFTESWTDKILLVLSFLKRHLPHAELKKIWNNWRLLRWWERVKTSDKNVWQFSLFVWIRQHRFKNCNIGKCLYENLSL